MARSTASAHGEYARDATRGVQAYASAGGALHSRWREIGSAGGVVEAVMVR